jgi:hypothetical protein
VFETQLNYDKLWDAKDLEISELTKALQAEREAALNQKLDAISEAIKADVIAELQQELEASYSATLTNAETILKLDKELERYKAALEKCRCQRDSYIGSPHTWGAEEITEDDQELERILKNS